MNRTAVLGVSSAIWTFSQTLLHSWWILFGRHDLSCSASFSTDCRNGSSYDTEGSVSLKQLKLNFFLDFNSSDAEKLMLAYVILDVIWLIASVSLLLSAIFSFTGKTRKYFCTPWLMTTALSSILDIYCSVYFGLNSNDKIQKWLQNVFPEDKIGRDEQKDSSSSDELYMLLLSTRGCIVWIVNVVLLFFMLKALGIKRSQQGHVFNFPPDKPTNQDRINNWYKFYGI